MDPTEPPVGAFEDAFESESLELVRRIRAGDQEAWNELFDRYHDALLLAVRMRLGEGLRRHLQSEDVFQSVALDAFKALPGFEYRGEGSLQRFLRTLVLNKIRDRADTYGALKRAGDEPLSEAHREGLAAPGSEPGYRDPETYERLERALKSLPEELREVLLLRQVEGLSHRELAARTGRGEDAVRKLYSRALARLTLAMGPRS